MKVREEDRSLEQSSLADSAEGQPLTWGSDGREVINVSLPECVKDQMTGWHWRGMEKASGAATETDSASSSTAYVSAPYYLHLPFFLVTL